MLARVVSTVAIALTLLFAPSCSSEDEPAGVDAGAESADAGDPLPYMSECQTNDQCESDLCFSFNAKGPHCTHGCVNDEDCAEPSPGCNNMGVCKAPDL